MPRTRDDLPRVDRRAGWVPRWTAEDVERYRLDLAGFAGELDALGLLSAGAPGGTADIDLSEQREARALYCDARLLASALARATYEIETVMSWRRDPWFYIDQSMGTLYDLLLPPGPIDGARAKQVVTLLESCGPTLDAGVANCAGHLTRELAEVALGVASTAGRDLLAALDALTPELPGPWHDQVARAGTGARMALDRFAAWLADAVRDATPLKGVGFQAFSRYIYDVALLPFTPTELLAAGRQEWDRSVAFEMFEQRRAPDAAWPPLPASASAQAERERVAELEVRDYYEEHDLLTQPVSLRHYLNAPRPAYLEPIRWLGVSDDLTGPDRLDQDGISYVPVPSETLSYFYRANAADPRAGIVHEGAHYQQMALAWRDARPARRHFFDSVPNEGIAFYNEEMLSQAGLFDDAPITRRIIYNFMRLRALRVEVDVRLALGELTIGDAGALLEQRVPMDRATAEEEAAMFAAIPAQGLSYTIGKLQLLRLLADCRIAEGESFSLREFHDWLWRNGNVPFALLRFERLGDRRELDRIDELRAQAL